MKLPEKFKEYFLSRWNPSTLDSLIQGLDAEPSVSIRLNPARLPLDALPEGADGRVPWCPEGIYLRERPLFTADPLFHAGAYYVQDASSMFLAHVLRHIFQPSNPSTFQSFNLSTFQSSNLSTFSFADFCRDSTIQASLMALAAPKVQPSSVLDLCAAPGGKSTLLRSLLPDDCLLVANEPNRTRVQVLAENMAKWGHPNVLVTQAMAADFADSAAPSGDFDLILADVPCSGEGMFRKEEEAVRQWSPQLVAECAALQRSIIRDVWPALCPGGTLIYSTCTFNPEEDEDNVKWIAQELGAEIVPIPVNPTWGIVTDSSDSPPTSVSLPFCHFLPGLIRGEGFFLAVLRKHGEPENADFIEERPKNEKRKERRNKKGKHKEEHRTLRERLAASLTTLSTDQLDAPDSPRVELSLNDAIRYLRREALTLPPQTPRGTVTVCFRGQRLGLMNNLGTRANNLYPREWRIRSTFVEGHCLFPENSPILPPIQVNSLE